MQQKESITLRQFQVMIFVFVLGDSVLVLPSGVIADAKQDAWISGLISIIFGVCIILLFYKIASINREGNLIDICQIVLGNWAGKITAIIYLLYSLMTVALLIRELSAFMLTHFLVNTPIQVVMGLFIIAAVYALKSGINSIARTTEIFFPWMLLWITLLIIVLFPKINLEEVSPIYENGMKPIIKGAITFTAFPFMEIIPIIMFFSLVKDEKIMKKDVVIPVTAGGLVLVLVTFYSLTVLGLYTASNSLYPTLKVSQHINIGQFIQRLDIIIATLWLLTIFYKTNFYFYTVITGTAQLLKLKRKTSLALPFGLLLVAMGMIVSGSIVELNELLITVWPFVDWTVCLFIPIIILIVWELKKGGDQPS